MENSNLQLSIEESLENSWDTLAQKGWVELDIFKNDLAVNSLIAILRNELDKGSFKKAGIGADWRNRLEVSIRKSQVCWIEDWNSKRSLKNMNTRLSWLMDQLNKTFYLSLKRFESQLAFYPEGGFYKKHLDQMKGRNNRQITLIIYLNDCPEGGQLVLFEREDKMKQAAVISPQKGKCVLFFSSQIYHEVLETKVPRFSLTTWFRDDEILI